MDKQPHDSEVSDVHVTGPTQGMLFDMERPVPDWMRSIEPWLANDMIVRGIFAGKVYCEECGKRLRVGEQRARKQERYHDEGNAKGAWVGPMVDFPCDDDGKLYCGSCLVALYPMVPHGECERCGDLVIASPGWAIGSYDGEEIPKCFVHRFWESMDIWENAFHEDPDERHYFCGSCVLEYGEPGDHPEWTEYCEGCGRLFDVRMGGGHWVGEEGYWECWKCWLDRVLKSGFCDKELMDEEYYIDAWDHLEEVRQAGYIEIFGLPLEWWRHGDEASPTAVEKLYHTWVQEFIERFPGVACVKLRRMPDWQDEGWVSLWALPRNEQERQAMQKAAEAYAVAWALEQARRMRQVVD